MAEQEYIEREAFLDAIERGKKYQQDADDIAEMLQNFPAADARPAVLCRECKHYERLDLFRNSLVWSGMCHYWNDHATREDGFCFKAAKREES